MVMPIRLRTRSDAAPRWRRSTPARRAEFGGWRTFGLMACSPAKSRVPIVGVEDVRAALACPDFYPDGPDRVDVRETHISWVFLAGDRAYKLKKPLVRSEERRGGRQC